MAITGDRFFRARPAGAGDTPIPMQTPPMQPQIANRPGTALRGRMTPPVLTPTPTAVPSLPVGGAPTQSLPEADVAPAPAPAPALAPVPAAPAAAMTPLPGVAPAAPVQAEALRAPAPPVAAARAAPVAATPGFAQVGVRGQRTAREQERNRNHGVAGQQLREK